MEIPTFRARLGAAVLLLFAFLSLRAQNLSSGCAEGRITHALTGQSLNNARVSVKGTTRETFTDEAGTFRLDDLPPGAATLLVSFTGLQAQEIPIRVSPDQAAVYDVALTSRARRGDGEHDPVTLDSFTVEATRETNASPAAARPAARRVGRRACHPPGDKRSRAFLAKSYPPSP